METKNPWRDSSDVGSNSFEWRFSVYFNRDLSRDDCDLNVYLGVYKLGKYVKHDFQETRFAMLPTICITMAKCNAVIISSKHLNQWIWKRKIASSTSREQSGLEGIKFFKTLFSFIVFSGSVSLLFYRFTAGLNFVTMSLPKGDHFLN